MADARERAAALPDEVKAAIPDQLKSAASPASNNGSTLIGSGRSWAKADGRRPALAAGGMVVVPWMLRRRRRRRRLRST